jgi:hypothetical protein
MEMCYHVCYDNSLYNSQTSTISVSHFRQIVPLRYSFAVFDAQITPFTHTSLCFLIDTRNINVRDTLAIRELVSLNTRTDDYDSPVCTDDNTNCCMLICIVLHTKTVAHIKKRELSYIALVCQRKSTSRGYMSQRERETL